MRGWIAVLLLTSVTGCATTAAAGKTREQLIRELNVLVDRCSPGRKVEFELIGRTHLRIQASPSASFEEVDCFIAGIRPYHFDLGFVGNEAYGRR